MAKRVRPKAILREGNENKNKDCYVPGPYHVAGTCPGIPKSNKCAACRMKKNFMGVEG